MGEQADSICLSDIVLLSFAVRNLHSIPVHLNGLPKDTAKTFGGTSPCEGCYGGGYLPSLETIACRRISFGFSQAVDTD